MVDHPRDDDFPDVMPEEKRSDLVLDAASLLANLIDLKAAPWLGGVVGNVVGGWSARKKLERIQDVILGLATRLAEIQVEVREDYVRSDEFEDLVDQTLRRVANERHAEKRRLYRNLLVGAATTPARYDEQLRFLRVIEELQAAHVQVLTAITAPPKAPSGGRYQALYISQIQILRSQLPDLPEELLKDLLRQLDMLGVISTKSLDAMTHEVDARRMLTDFGRRFVTYLGTDLGGRL